MTGRRPRSGDGRGEESFHPTIRRLRLRRRRRRRRDGVERVRPDAPSGDRRSGIPLRAFLPSGAGGADVAARVIVFVAASSAAACTGASDGASCTGASDAASASAEGRIRAVRDAAVLARRELHAHDLLPRRPARDPQRDRGVLARDARSALRRLRHAPRRDPVERHHRVHLGRRHRGRARRAGDDRERVVVEPAVSRVEVRPSR